MNSSKLLEKTMHYLKFTSCLFSRNNYIYSKFNFKDTISIFKCRTNCRLLHDKKTYSIKSCNNYVATITLNRISCLNPSLKVINVVPCRSFKTSEQRRFHPIIWMVVKPILKITAVLTGRGFRKWWRELPKDKKSYFISVLKANKNKFVVAFIVTTILSLGYYVSHLEETPITKRVRFMAFNTKQLEKINDFELEQIMEKLGPQIIPAHHPATKRVTRIVNRILKANEDIKEVHDKKWGISVVDNSIENAFVLPIGHVFVFTGMLNLCSNDDQLGTILAHEIAHCLQNHGAENVSFVHLLDLFSILVIAAIWAVLPSDSISLLTHWLYNRMIEVLFQLPYNRKIEVEADKVGLMLAAKACIDVRESSAFWSKMSFLKNKFGGEPDIEFISTHPSHESRSEYLDSIMDKAIELRENCGCPKLRQRDPRLDIEAVSKALDITRRQYLEHNPKPVIVFKTS